MASLEAISQIKDPLLRQRVQDTHDALNLALTIQSLCVSEAEHLAKSDERLSPRPLYRGAAILRRVRTYLACGTLRLPGEGRPGFSTRIFDDRMLVPGDEVTLTIRTRLSPAREFTVETAAGVVNSVEERQDERGRYYYFTVVYTNGYAAWGCHKWYSELNGPWPHGLVGMEIKRMGA